MSKKEASYKFGMWAEELTVWYLRLCFYTILSRRYRSHAGEVDIIARRGKNLVFVEVKARKSNKDIHDVLSKYQQNRITRAALIFLSRNPKYNESSIRFDLILLSPKFLLKHIKNAWAGDYL